MGGKKDMRDSRFLIEHADDPEYLLATRSSDGQMLFLANMLEQDEAGHEAWAAGSPRCTTAARSSPGTPDRGESNHPPLDHRERLAGGHRWPCRSTCSTTPGSPPTSGCSATGKPPIGAEGPAHRRHALVQAPRKNLGKKNCELSEEDITRICGTFLAFEGTEQSKIFPNQAFGYWKVIVERPLRLAVDLSPEQRVHFRAACREAGRAYCKRRRPGGRGIRRWASPRLQSLHGCRRNGCLRAWRFS